MASGEAAAADAGDGAERRDAIVRAAAGTIARRGVRGLRVEEVAALAGVSPALLYYHFGSRAGVVRAALEHASDLAPSTALGGEVPGANGFEALAAALRDELDDDAAVREAAIVWGEVSASAVFDPELRDAVRKVTEDWRANVAAGIRAGIADGSIAADVDPDLAADVLISLVDGLCTRWLTGALPRDEARRLLDDALRRSLRHRG
jgi:AcrR family transcriptional regulator